MPCQLLLGFENLTKILVPVNFVDFPVVIVLLPFVVIFDFSVSISTFSSVHKHFTRETVKRRY